MTHPLDRHLLDPAYDGDWREIPEFPGYEVSRSGDVRSWLLRGPTTGRRRVEPRRLEQAVQGGTWYACLQSPAGGRAKQRTIRTAVLVARCWLGAEHLDVKVRWKNGDRLDTRAENIEIVSQ